MSQTIDDPPYKTRFIDESGFLTLPWMIFFRQLFTRIGTNKALSNTELEVVRTDDISALTQEVTSLAGTVATLSSTVLSLSGELNQGPTL